MEPRNSFRKCPRCGAEGSPGVESRCFMCEACGYCLYFNPAPAVAGIVRDGQGNVLLIRRANEPARGKLTLPGGFVDFNETAEAALCREMKEEVNVGLADVKFLATFPNRYCFRGLTYQTLDIFFTARLRCGRANALDEVESVLWLPPGRVRVGGLAFKSVRKAWKLWRGLKEKC